ncbi:MAG: error-prone DNA polymerase [Bryobacterales bacterium]|nr:error-prone DNA polymerase [Bryobacterales bacterium]
MGQTPPRQTGPSVPGLVKNPPRYVELHARSAFSFLRGASEPEELAAAAADLGMPAMALLDRDGVYGAPRFHMAAKKLGLRAHIGAEITAADGAVHALLAESRTGYQNLCRLITRMKLRARKYEGAAAPHEFAEFAQGLICLVRDPERLAWAVETFGPRNVYAELQRHLDRRQEARNQALVERARRLRIPLLATNGVAYARPAEREILDVLTCVREKVRLDSAGRLLQKNGECYLKPAAEMERLFADLPEAIANTRELSQRLDFTLAGLGYEFPRYPVPPGETMNSFLRQRTEEGARQRYRPYQERARRQIEHELALIEKLGLAGYFLIVWDLVQFCRRSGILAQGRGSAANSAVCYSLGITAVDPVGMELLFERFLSEERGEWPDIDLDLPSGDQRERVIQYVYERYGRLGAAMTANVITYRGRSAAREVGKVLGFDEQTAGRLAGLVRTFEWQDPKYTPGRQFADAGLDLSDPRIRKFMELYLAVQHLPRHLGQHSGGMVICQGQLDSVVPLEPATMPGRVVIQWDKDDCADLGLIKVDLLGLGMMAVLEETLTLVRESRGEEVDLAHLPPDDPAVYEALQKADTVGLFQVESRAQMACLPRVRPEKFYDIVVQVGIIRPGPIVGRMVNPYIKRRQGREPAECLHPSLEPVLRRTLGVPLFQEQLLRMAMIAAGFSGGEAEELRRAFSHKRSEARMKEIEVRLRSGMRRNGITGEAQDRIVQSITSFALYGFPESHAASFALLAYASAYLKCHYPAAFLAALLNNQPMGFYHPATLVKDAQRHGVKVWPLDVTRSHWRCTVEREGVRLGLCYLKGLRKEAGEAIVRARRERPFSSIDDLVRRVRELRKDEVTKLAAAGALNWIRPMHRRDALWHAGRAARPAGPLLEGLEEPCTESPLAPMTDRERLYADFCGTGLTVGPHPMSYAREWMNSLGVCRAADLARIPNGRRVRVAGGVIVRQRPGTARGFVFLSLEDETGIANAILTPDLFDTERLVVIHEPFLMVEGVLQNLDNVVSVKAQRLVPLTLNRPAPASHDFR